MTKMKECLVSHEKVLWYQCSCGYETPVSTGMMNHLNMYRKCRWKQAFYKTKDGKRI